MGRLREKGTPSLIPTPPLPLAPIGQINRIFASPEEAPGTSLCIAVRPSGLCTTMEQLCGDKICTYSIFSTPTANGDFKCCPVRTWADQ